MLKRGCVEAGDHLVLEQAGVEGGGQVGVGIEDVGVGFLLGHGAGDLALPGIQERRVGGVEDGADQLVEEGHPRRSEDRRIGGPVVVLNMRIAGGAVQLEVVAEPVVDDQGERLGAGVVIVVRLADEGAEGRPLAESVRHQRADLRQELLA